MKYLYLFLAFLCISQGQAQLKSYHYRQELQGVLPHHWHQLSLPSTVFQHLESGYDDLRIYGVSATDTIEVVIAGYNLGYTVEAGIAPYRNIGKA